MKRALLLVPVFLAGALSLLAQPATITVTDTLYMAVGGPTFCSGTFTLTWSDFYSRDGYLIKAGTSAAVPVNAMGVFSVDVVPTNTNTTPASGIYQIRYNLQPTNCAPASEYWNVPAMGPADLNMVRTLPTPPPSLIPVASIGPPATLGTYQVCYVNGVVQWAMCSSGGSGITGSGTSGKLAKFTATTVIANAAASDIVANFTGCSGTQYLGADGACHTPISQLTSAAIIGLWSGCSGTQYLGADGNCHTTISQLTSAAIIALWTSCSGTQYLGADGACHNAGGGSGTVTSFSAGTLSPVFTTSVATSTTTPALSFSLTNAGANTYFGNPTGSGAGPIYMTATQATAGLNLFTSSLQGVVPASGGGNTNFMRADGSWAVPLLACANFPTLTGDTTTPGLSCVTSTVKVNGGSIPASAVAVATNSSSQFVAATFQGNGAKVQASTGTTTTNDCVKFDANGNTVDSGAACSGGGSGFIQALTAPSSGSFTALNFNTGTSVVTTQANLSSPVTAITLKQHDPGSTENIAALAKSKIAATFTVTEGMSMASGGSNECVSGIWLSDGGSPPNNITFGWQTVIGMRGVYYTNFTSYSSDTVSPSAQTLMGTPLIWLRIQETASARLYSISSDGVTFSQVETESNTAHFTTSQYGFALAPRSMSSATPDCQITVYSFTETTP
jgi:hypothetical protein